MSTPTCPVVRGRAYRQAFEHLYEAAKDVAGVVVEPATG